MKSPAARNCQLPPRPGPTSEAADHLSSRGRELQWDCVVEMMTTTIWRNYVGYRHLHAEMALASALRRACPVSVGEIPLGAQDDNTDVGNRISRNLLGGTRRRACFWVNPTIQAQRLAVGGRSAEPLTVCRGQIAQMAGKSSIGTQQHWSAYGGRVAGLPHSDDMVCKGQDR